MKSIEPYIELTKPGILGLVATTTAVGFVMGAGGEVNFSLLCLTLIGTALTCGGSGALNHYLERDFDSQMNRTHARPIPSGRIEAADALYFGLALVTAGTALLVWQVNLLTGFLALLTTFLYAFVYTPLKRLTWLNTSIGAIPGALPPLGGWAAATGEIGVGAWIIFAIQFLWQHPHFFAIAWIYRQDYARGGFKMLPVLDQSGERTFAQILLFSILLLPISLFPALVGISGATYLIGATGLGVALAMYSISLAQLRTIAAAKRVFFGSIIYLPALFGLMVIDLFIHRLGL